MISLLLGLVAAQSNVTGNCVTGRLDFDPLRTFAAGATKPQLDVSKYDFTIDYGSSNVVFNNKSGVDVVLRKNAQNTGDGARISTTRYVLYGRITARLRTPTNGAGIVTTFITMSDVKDEIDWEMVGASNKEGQSNVFYRGIPEFGVHGGIHTLPSGTTEQYHTYTIDWRSDMISFYIDNQLMRTYKNDANAVSKMTPPGQRWFPTTPSLVQFSVWDGCKDGISGTCTWSGGPVNFKSVSQYTASFDYVDIQCYDDKNNIVEKWPVSAQNPTRQQADPAQPTAAGDRVNSGSPNAVGALGPTPGSIPKSSANGFKVPFMFGLLGSLVQFM
ncbi:concanavalin A-like lectin/glucanase domain-containing protein [Gorgonomyces haynaldii]|nr:concanavalin A-like lectin/glucanase domain-containing protein [Gorgonomyces haynaldii]